MGLPSSPSSALGWYGWLVPRQPPWPPKERLVAFGAGRRDGRP